MSPGDARLSTGRPPLHAQATSVLDTSADDRRRQNDAMDTDLLDVDSGADLVTDITEMLLRFCRSRGDGLCHVFVPHATAGVAILETGSGTEADLADAVERILPRAEHYRHRHGSPGHGRDHVLPTFVSPSLVVPVLRGVPALGTWQSVVLVDSNVDNPHRQVRLSFLPG
jgi:secondary thiamine-phosphate synthase enzyme